MTELTDMPIRTIGKILQAIDVEGESYVYGLHKSTRITLDYLYKVLPQMRDSGLLEYIGEREGRKYLTLTDNGRLLVNLYRNMEERRRWLHKAGRKEAIQKEEAQLAEASAQLKRAAEVSEEKTRVMAFVGPERNVRKLVPRLRAILEQLREGFKSVPKENLVKETEEERMRLKELEYAINQSDKEIEIPEKIRTAWESIERKETELLRKVAILPKKVAGRLMQTRGAEARKTELRAERNLERQAPILAAEIQRLDKRIRKFQNMIENEEQKAVRIPDFPARELAKNKLAELLQNNENLKQFVAELQNP